MSQVSTIENSKVGVDTLCEPAAQQSLSRWLAAKIFQPSVRQALVTLVDQGFCSVTNFLTGVLLARACSKEEYGLYVLSFTLLVVVMDIQVSLSGTPFTVLSPYLKNRDRQFYFGSTLIQHLAVSVLAAIGFIIAATVLSVTGRLHGFVNVLLTLAVASVFMLLRDFMRFVFLSQLRVWASMLMGVIANVATIGLLFWAYFNAKLTVPIGYLIMAGCSGLTALLILLKEKKQISFSTKRFYEHLRNNWTFGKWLVAQAIVDFVAIRLYPWALILFKDSSAVAAYGICVIFAGVINPLLMGLNRFLGPRAAHVASNKTPAFAEVNLSLRKRVSRVHREIYCWMALIVAPLFLFLISAFLFGERAIVAIYGGKFAGVGSIFSIYLLSQVIAAEGVVISAGTNALKRPDISFKAQIVGLTATITVGLFLAYRWGTLGAVIGVCVSRLVTLGYQFKQFKYLEKVR